jgi:FtsH-binding integral membrane protein
MRKDNPIRKSARSIMTQRRTYYKSTNISPLTLIGLIIFALAAFFVALPLFLGALVVFSIAAFYMAWRIRKVVRQFEKECARRKDEADSGLDASSLIIDVTPDRTEQERDQR